MKNTKIALGMAAVGFGMMACNEPVKTEEVAATTVKAEKPFDLGSMNTDVNPCSDFYEYAIGSWLKNNPIPDTESRWGSFEYLREQNSAKLKALLADLKTNTSAGKGSDAQLVRDFYASALDSAKVEELGKTPILAELAKIEKISSKGDLFAYLVYARTHSIGSPFSFYITADSKNSTENIATLAQGGLGLPDKDFYRNEDPKMQNIRTEYLVHLEKMFLLIGTEAGEAKAAAKTIMDIETKLADLSMDRVTRRDPHKTYNKMSVPKLAGKAKGFDWAMYFKGIGAGSLNTLNVSQPEFIAGFANLFNTISVEDWKLYQTWNLVNGASGYLSADFVKQDFYFYSTVLNGVDKMKPRWKTALGKLNGSFGETFGKLYVEKYFAEQSKQDVAQLIENLRKSFRARIGQLEWMSADTKEKALEKLNSFTYKIGYPDKWKDYSSLDIKPDALFANSMQVRAKHYQEMMDKIGKPVDKTEWHMSPQTINAYYNPLYNEVVFPAAILQPPFYNPEADDALNYGGIGAVIGHEFTHGFDDKGCLYNSVGNLENWWTEQDLDKFNGRAQMIIDQYSGYEALAGLNVNGALTIGENIADLGGLTLAYHALEMAYEGKDKPADIDGFNYKQRVFLGWANVWKNNIKDEALLTRIKSDSHSPGRFRVNGTLANMIEFQEAFSCKDEDPMINSGEKRAVIW